MLIINFLVTTKFEGHKNLEALSPNAPRGYGLVPRYYVSSGIKSMYPLCGSKQQNNVAGWAVQTPWNGFNGWRMTE